MLVLALTVTITLLDQVTKHMVRSRFLLGEQLEIIPGFFSLTYIRNTGAAWGIFSGLNHILIALSAVMLTVLVLFRRTLLTDTLTHRIAAAMLIAGIVGNLLDRVRLGYVVDFLDFYVRASPHFPAFNVADSAICTGMGLYLLSQWPAAKSAPDAPPAARSES